MKRPDTGILILAAGASSRMGRPKQMLDYQSGTLLGSVVQTANALMQGLPLVVLGAHAGQIWDAHKDMPAEFIINSNWKKGMGTSLSFGLEELQKTRAEMEAVMVLLTDQPLVSVTYLEEMLSRWRLQESGIVASQYNEGPGVPAIFGKSHFPDLLRLDADQGARKIILNYLADTFLMPVGSNLLDIDSPEDYQKLKDRG